MWATGAKQVVSSDETESSLRAGDDATPEQRHAVRLQGQVREREGEVPPILSGAAETFDRTSITIDEPRAGERHQSLAAAAFATLRTRLSLAAAPVWTRSHARRPGRAGRRSPAPVGHRHGRHALASPVVVCPSQPAFSDRSRPVCALIAATSAS